MKLFFVRKANAADINAITHFYAKQLQEWGATQNYAQETEYTELLTKQIQLECVFIAEIGDTLIGVISYIDTRFAPYIALDRVHLTTAIVSSTFRRQGVASGILLTMAQHCRHLNIPRITTDCSKDNTAATNLLTRLGFRSYNEETQLNQCPTDIFLEISTEELITNASQDQAAFHQDTLDSE